MQLEGIENIEFENFTIEQLEKISASISLWSLFKKVKPVDLIIQNPSIVIHSLQELSPRIRIKKGMAFAINTINISNGNLSLQHPDFSANILAFNLKYKQRRKERQYRLTSPHLEIQIPVQNQKRILRGPVNAQFEQQENVFKIKSYNWGTRDIHITAYGSLQPDGTWDVNLNTQGDLHDLLHPILGEFTPRGLTYGNIDLSRKDDLIALSGLVNSPSITSAGQAYTRLSSRVFWNNRDRRIRVINSFFSTPDLRTTLNVTELEDRVEVRVEKARLDKILKMLDIYRIVPAQGIVEQSIFHINPERLWGSGEVKALETDPGRGFNSSGIIAFSHDFPGKITQIQSRQLETRAAIFSRLEGRFDPHGPRNTVSVKATIKDLTTLNRYTMAFADLDLSYWHLTRGQGPVTVEYRENPSGINTQISFRLSNLGINGQDIREFQGKLEGQDDRFSGEFNVSDPSLSGMARLDSSSGNLTITSPRFQGRSQKILHILDLGWLDLTGPVLGNFSYQLPAGESQPRIHCSLDSDQLTFLIFPLEEISLDLNADFEQLSLNNLSFRYQGGEGQARIYLHHINQDYDLEGRIDNIDLSRFTPGLSGRGSLAFQTRGQYPRDPVQVTYRVDSASFYADRVFGIEGQAIFHTDLTDFHLQVTGNAINNGFQSPFQINFEKEALRYSGKFNLQLNEIDLLIPWKDNRGVFILEGEIYQDENTGITASGIGRFHGEILNFPGFPYTLDDFEGYLTFQEGNFRLNELKGTMGRGDVEMTGSLFIRTGKISDLNLNLRGRELDLYPMDRFRCKINTGLSLSLEEDQLFLRGSINFLSADWRKEIDESIFFNTDPVLSSSEDMFLKMLRYDINLLGDKNIFLENSLATAECKLNLTLQGNVDFPRLSGYIESRKGKIFFSNREFNLITGKLTFTDKLLIDPKVDIKAEGFIKNYRVNINIDGTANNLKPELASSPPLPSQDILALISMGELFERPSSEEMGARIGSAGMLSLTLTSELQKRAKELLGIDLLEFNPDVSSPLLEGKSYFTIGKSISDNFVILYSTNMSAARKEIWYAKYLLSKNLSLIGMRNEDGNFSLEIRFRKRR